jgi:hypothetical protein
MSYTSTNTFPSIVNIDLVYQIIEWLGYERNGDEPDIPNMLRSQPRLALAAPLLMQGRYGLPQFM